MTNEQVDALVVLFMEIMTIANTSRQSGPSYPAHRELQEAIANAKLVLVEEK